MFEEIVKQALNDMINHLGQPIIYTYKSGKTSFLISVIKTPLADVQRNAIDVKKITRL